MSLSSDFLCVLRGGAWDYASRDVHCADRTFNYPGIRHSFYGFRLVAAVKESYHVRRGGSWIIDARNVRCARREAFVTTSRYAHDGGFRPVAAALTLLVTCLLFGGCTLPRCSDFCGPGEARFCLPDDMRHALEKVDEMEKTGDRGPCHWSGPRYLITRHYLGAVNDFQTQISRTVTQMPGDAQCILIVESLRKDSPTGRQTEMFLVPAHGR